MKTKYILTLMLSSLIGLQAFSQTKYSLENCKTMAIENNKTVKNSHLQTQASKESEKEAFTNYFPSVSASGMGFNAKDPLVSMKMGGTSMGLLKDGMVGAVTLTQPVFAGGKIYYGNKLAKLGVEVSEQQVRLSENEVLLRAENSYWELVSLYEKMNTIDILDKQVSTLLKDVQVAYDAGLITNNDVLQVKLRQNNLKSDKINLENGISLAKMALCQLIGIDIETSEDFDIERPVLEDANPPMAYYVNHREALNSLAENQLLDQNVDATKLQTKMKRADYMPTVAVGASYLQDNLMDKWQGNGAVFVSVSIPISGWWGGSHAIKKQKIQEEIAYNDKIDGQDKLLLRMQKVKNELDNSYKQILVAQESIEQSTENLRLNNDFYQAGIVNLTDVLDAQSLLQQSRDKYVDAHAEYQRKQFEYLQVTGR